jgi:hypothetical protein
MNRFAPDAGSVIAARPILRCFGEELRLGGAQYHACLSLFVVVDGNRFALRWCVGPSPIGGPFLPYKLLDPWLGHWPTFVVITD